MLCKDRDVLFYRIPPVTALIVMKPLECILSFCHV